jgi:hypothetical protein
VFILLEKLKKLNEKSPLQLEAWEIDSLMQVALEQAENINVALYELNILHEKVNPTKHSSIDSHFNRIKDILNNN